MVSHATANVPFDLPGIHELTSTSFWKERSHSESEGALAEPSRRVRIANFLP